MKLSLGPSEIQRINIILGIGIVCLLGLFGFLYINQPDMFACKLVRLPGSSPELTRNLSSCSSIPRFLHLFSFKTPTSWAVMSEEGDADCASSMRNGVKFQEGMDCEELDTAYTQCMNRNSGYAKKCETEDSQLNHCSNNNKNECEKLQKRANEILQENKKLSEKFSKKDCGQIENINKSECKTLQKNSEGIFHDYSLIMDKLKANKCK